MGEPVAARKPVAQAETRTASESRTTHTEWLQFRLTAPGQPEPDLPPWHNGLTMRAPQRSPSALDLPWHEMQSTAAIEQPEDRSEQDVDPVAMQAMTLPSAQPIQRQEESGEVEEAGEEEQELRPKRLGEFSQPLVQRRVDVEAAKPGKGEDAGGGDRTTSPFHLYPPGQPQPELPQRHSIQAKWALQRSPIAPEPYWYRGQPLQAKLTVGQPNDVYEQEADRVAEQVMSMALPATPTVQRQVEEQMEEEDPEALQTKPLAETITPLVQRQERLEEDDSIQAKCETCEQENPIQRAADGVPQVQPDLESRLNASQGGGSALPDEVRSFMEPRFGTDFSQVRVHTGSEAVQMNRDLNAQAFTHKQDVYFGMGKAPAKDALTAHELTHILQQTGRVKTDYTSIQRKGKVGQITNTAPLLKSDLGIIQRDLFESSKSNKELIQDALKSNAPGDVKKIKNFGDATQDEKFKLINILLNQGWVGPRDEYSLEAIWSSFGSNVAEVASNNYNLWKICIDRGAELDKLPAVQQLQEKFKSDVEQIALNHLTSNERYVKGEMVKYGLSEKEDITTQVTKGQGVDPKSVNFTVSDEQVKKLEEVKKLAIVAKQLKMHLEQMKQAKVAIDQSTFDPQRSPQPEGNNIPLGDQTMWQMIKSQWDTANELLALIANSDPALFSAISQEDGTLDTIVQSTPKENPVAALNTIRTQMVGSLANIQIARPNVKEKYYYLKPIHDQLYGGMTSPSGTNWSLKLNQWAAKQEVKGRETADFWKLVGLEAATFAALIVADIATLGGATFLIATGAGLSSAALKAKLAEDKATTMNAMSQSNVKSNTALVYKGQVTAAEAAAEEERINLIITATFAGAGAVGSAVEEAKAAEIAQRTTALRSRYAEEIAKDVELQKQIDQLEKLLKEPAQAEQQLEKIESKLSDSPATIPSILSAKSSGIIDRITSDRYYIVDATNEKFKAWAQVESDGTLIIDMRAKLESGERSTVINGPDQMKKIHDFFKGKMNGIRGSWSYGDNIDKFNELTRQGMKLEEAALETFSGIQAAKAGFTKATIESLEGSPGAYTKVKVLFQ